MKKERKKKKTIEEKQRNKWKYMISGEIDKIKKKGREKNDGTRNAICR